MNFSYNEDPSRKDRHENKTKATNQQRISAAVRHALRRAAKIARKTARTIPLANGVLQSVERMTSILVLPHPERSQPEVRRLQPDPEAENTAMQLVMDHERARGCQVYDIHEKNLGYDITSLDLNSGELRLIEVKDIGAATGTVLLTANERRVAEERRDCYCSMLSRAANPTLVFRSRSRILPGFPGMK